MAGNRPVPGPGQGAGEGRRAPRPGEPVDAPVIPGDLAEEEVHRRAAAQPPGRTRAAGGRQCPGGQGELAPRPVPVRAVRVRGVVTGY